MERVGVDIGGTFTDLVVYDEATGGLRKTKTLTTPDMPEQGLLLACRERGVDPQSVAHFLHATTLVTNLLIQRAGEDVGLVTTKGFRHCLEVGDGRRADTYSLQWERPRPFAPTHLVVEVDERIDAHGRIVRSLERSDVERALRPLLATGVKSIAVSLLHSYANAVHEQQVADILHELAPDVHVSLSSAVDPRIREFQRTSTTVLNAYAMPRVHGYVERLDTSLEVPHGIHYMHSGGGIIPSTVARRFPVMLVESGPAAGVLAGAFLGRKLGIANIMTADMGGTSYDVCVIRDGIPEIKDTVEVEPTIPLRTECIDVMSIGAGGGSIAWIDDGGALKVGPQSAGANPGPACYGRGGTQPTVTDANVVLGLLDPDTPLAGGALRIDAGRAEAAIGPLAEHFKVSLVEAAQGIYRIVNANMAQAMRKITVHKGIDPREFTLVPFGGAGGQHAVELARELGMAAVLFPANASVLSAFGLLTADLKYTATNSLWRTLDGISPEDLEGYFKELTARAVASLHAEERTSVVRVTTERSLDIRYVGQSYDLRVTVDDGPVDTALIYRAFEAVYRARYGVVLGDPLEIINAHVTATGHIKPLELPRGKPTATERAQPRASRTVALKGRRVPVYDRRDLAPGLRISGSCLIEEPDTTIYIPDGCVSEVDDYGNIRTLIQGRATGRRRARQALDPFTAEIIRSYLTSTVDEMVKTTTGAAYSTCFAEGGDFTCALFDAKGRMVAQALGLPIHAGSLFDAIKTILKHFDRIDPGDVIVTNDPYQGGSHQPDAVVVRPVFTKKQLIALAVNRGHWTDIGGMSAGGWTGSATHVLQEALIIPPVKLYRAGQVDTQVRDFILKNVRLPKQLWGDIQSQIASNLTAERRLHDLVDRYGLELVLAGMEDALAYSREHLRRRLEGIPDGVGHGSDVLDDDGYRTDRTYEVHVTLTKRPDKISIDCAGTSEQGLGPVNMSLATSKGAAYAAVLSLVDPSVPLNEAIVEVVDLHLPEGTLVNPRYPAPVAAYYAIMTRLAESVVFAMTPLRPDLVVAGSYGDAQNVSGWGFHPETGQEFIWYLFQCGGTGGRATRDGNTGIRHMLSNARSESLEVWEKRYPLFFLAYEVVPDSGGPGKFRGGLGLRRVMRLEADTFITANTDRLVARPQGVFSGCAGAPNRLMVIRDGVERSFADLFGFPSPSKFSNARLRKGDIVICELGGGGGYGDPLQRDPRKVEWDVLNGWVSVDKAREAYAVVIDPATGRHEPEATQQLRQGLAES